MRKTTINEVHPKGRGLYAHLRLKDLIMDFMAGDEKLNNHLFIRRGTASQPFRFVPIRKCCPGI
jgi:hypothetical protein